MAGGGGYNQLGGMGGNYSNGKQPALGGGQSWMQSHPNANVFGSPGMVGGDAWKAAHPNYNVAGSPGWQAMHPQTNNTPNGNWWTGGTPLKQWNPAGLGGNPPLQGQPDIADFFQHMFGGGGGYGNNYLY